MAGKLLIAVALLSCSAEGLKIASYNIRLFGESKLRNEIAMNMTKQIVRQYDIVLIQELMSAGVPNALLDWVGRDDFVICNTRSVLKPKHTKHREMYLFLARKAVVSCSTKEIEDLDPTLAAKFRRPPTIAFFTTVKEEKKFFIVGAHTQPYGGVTDVEINALSTVYEYVRTELIINDGVVMGDFNYAPPYVTADQVDNLNVDHFPFKRLINHTVNTTVPGVVYPNETSKPYDRIYVAPAEHFPDSVVTSVGVDKFSGPLPNEAWYFVAVSDHYPIYFEVSFGGTRGEPPKSFSVTDAMLTAAYGIECEAVIKDSSVVDKEDIDDLYSDFLYLCTH